ncbi:MAG TPA: SMP-30/gluconolactonase/LRE family protein [Anaerolineae bacterium]|nr:SMP-30/gluconolactonase/LRE family protein [Anaerolineae bacterium]
MVTFEPSDGRFFRVLAPQAEPELLACGFQFIEGPAWHPWGRFLVFSDILGDSLYTWSPSQGTMLLRKPSHMANGNCYDLQGRLITCEHATSRVTRTEPDGSLCVMASHFEGRELNSPNDVVVSRDGAVYFTDPNSGRGTRFGVARRQELPFQGVFRLGPGEKLTLLVDDFSKPNGLCFSPSGERLFVDDTDRCHIRAFDVQANGRLTGGDVWAELPGEGVGVADGMKVDRNGNLYCTGPGGIHLFDSSGCHLGMVRMPEQTANLAWGDEDLCSLFITASTSLYRIRTLVPGMASF